MQQEPVVEHESTPLGPQLVHLARVALARSPVELTPQVRRLARELRSLHPTVSAELVDLLRSTPLRSAPPISPANDPVDSDSRLPLLRREDPVVLTSSPIFSPEVNDSLAQLVEEYRATEQLSAAGMGPSRTALFTGPPGVGKTLAARWVSSQLSLPLLTLDLSTVMSSLLGKTGENMRRVFMLGKSAPCVLLLDELDSVAKKRDDFGEVGELKRLVTVLLQEIDFWPEGSLLLAATNHPELLDRAIWRRFEMVVDFPMPAAVGIRSAVDQYLDGEPLDPLVKESMTTVFKGASYSDIERDLNRARRLSAVRDIPITSAVLQVIRDRFVALAQADRLTEARRLLATGLSQRQLHELTGVSRDTLRKMRSSETRGQ